MASGGARIGDAERQAIVDLLRHHTSHGRLTLDEFAERAGQVYASVTQDDLAQVIADLPEGVRPDTAPDPRARPTPQDAVGPARDDPRRARGPTRHRRFVAIMSGSHFRGQWRAAEDIAAFAFWGGVTVDLRNALIESPVIEIRAWAIMGSVEVVVPEGIPVELDGLVVMGGTSNRVKTAELIPGAPLVRVRARGMWGGVSVRTPRKRDRSRTRLGPICGVGHKHGSADVTALVEDALESARHVVDKALGPGSAENIIPRMPGADRQAEPATSRRGRHGSSRSWPTPPRPPRAPAPPWGWGRDEDEDAGAPTSTPTPTPQDAAPTPTSSTTATSAPRDAAPVPVDAAPAASANPGAAVPVGQSSAAAIAEDAAGGVQAIARAVSNGSRIPSGTLTIMVSDIAGSSEIAERLGDQEWLAVLQSHNAIVRARVADHNGTEVKAQGDGFLMVFPSARAAVLAGIDIQKAMAEYRDDHPEVPIDVRLGLHTGEVIATDDDVFGHNVVVASRIADTAGPGEIVVSGLTRALTASASDLGYDDGVEVSLKGVSQPWRVHRVLFS